MLNQPRYKGAQILLARENFGCGSSREHAPWALMDYGFRALIAPSYADIFFNNCFKNGLLPVVLDGTAVRPAVPRSRRAPGYRLTVDLDTADGHDTDGAQASLRHRSLSQALSARMAWTRSACTLQHADEIQRVRGQTQSRAALAVRLK